MLKEAGEEVEETGFTSDNSYAILIFELWLTLRHQAIYAFEVPKALDFNIMFRVFDLYEIPKHLQVWCFETLHYLSSSIFEAMADASAQKIAETTKHAGKSRNSH